MVPEQTFGYQMAVDDGVLHRRVRYTYITVNPGEGEPEGDPPSGATLCQRRSSVTIAEMYGNCSRSAKQGRRALPTTESISA
jgi:hypothetical protein